MNNTEWFSIRALTLPATAVALLAAFFIVWLVLRVQFPKKWAGVYGDAVFTFILVWKFSIIITDFKDVIAQPYVLLYFNGGTIGVILGTMTVSLQIWWKRRTFQFDSTGIIACTWAIILTQSIYQWLMVLLNDNQATSEVITLIVLSTLTILILWKITAINRALFLYTIGLMIVAFFQPHGLWQLAVGVSVILFILGIGVQRFAGVTKLFGGKG
ncbi:hypothetical protein ACQKNC_18070 [Lysinibacillus sp. NPDC094177]|uniref:hypothetical protein n=1 Tax=Lysinibacillus sp. NPDC094177 TaxID=3390580 RepID=UPI003D0282DD